METAAASTGLKEGQPEPNVVQMGCQEPDPAEGQPVPPGPPHVHKQTGRFHVRGQDPCELGPCCIRVTAEKSLALHETLLVQRRETRALLCDGSRPALLNPEESACLSQ